MCIRDSIHPWEGSPITYESFHQAYNADLVNGLGNLASRVLTMAERHLLEPINMVKNKLPLSLIHI